MLRLRLDVKKCENGISIRRLRDCAVCDVAEDAVTLDYTNMLIVSFCISVNQHCFQRYSQRKSRKH